jgi:transcriptional regulator with XRE-family HTH domain
LISKWECGRAEPHIEFAVDIARILGVAPERIFPEMFCSGVDEGERLVADKNQVINCD